MRRIFLHFLSRRQRKSVKRRRSYFDVCTSGLGFAFLPRRGISYLTSATTIIPPSRLPSDGSRSFLVKWKVGAKRVGAPPRTLTWFINAIVNDPSRPYSVISILTIEDRTTLIPEAVEQVRVIIFISV